MLRRLFNAFVKSICSAHDNQIFPWPACSPDIEHMWDLMDNRFARNPRPIALKNKL